MRGISDLMSDYMDEEAVKKEVQEDEVNKYLMTQYLA